MDVSEAAREILTLLGDLIGMKPKDMRKLNKQELANTIKPYIKFEVNK